MTFPRTDGRVAQPSIIGAWTTIFLTPAKESVCRDQGATNAAAHRQRPEFTSDRRLSLRQVVGAPTVDAPVPGPDGAGR